MENKIPHYIDLHDVKNFLGDKDYFIEVNNLKSDQNATNKLNKNMLPEQLFKWSIDNNFLGFCKYLYIKYRVPLSYKKFNSLTKFNKITFDSQDNYSMTTPIESDNGVNTSLKIELQDKKSIKKGEIINFLCDMRPYSTYTFLKGPGYCWVFNKY